MNYKLHYDKLIHRAQNRSILKSEYKEIHHIIPKCMDGSDGKENLIALFPEEHVLAHLLLIKIFPKHHGLLKAANMMTNCSNKNMKRNTNKMYGWLKRRFSKYQQLSMDIKFGHVKASAIKSKISTTLKGITLIDRFGVEKAMEINNNRSTNLKKNTTSKKEYFVVSPNNTITIFNKSNNQGSLFEFCKSNDLCMSSLVKVANGKKNHYKGWFCGYYNTYHLFDLIKWRSKMGLLHNKSLTPKIIFDVSSSKLSFQGTRVDICKKLNINNSLFYKLVNHNYKHKLIKYNWIIEDNLQIKKTIPQSLLMV